MKRRHAEAAERAGTVLLFAVVALCLAPTLIPPFLDRIYYEGSPGSHFDGKRFFNPGPAPRSGDHGGPQRFLNRWLGSDSRAAWPAHVPVRGTFQLTFEPIDEPRQRLEAMKRSRGIAPGRFIATEAGRSFTVP